MRTTSAGFAIAAAKLPRGDREPIVLREWARPDVDEAVELMLALARKIVPGEDDADSVESVFAQAQQIAAHAEAPLVDAEWAAPEPMVAEVATVVASSDSRGNHGEPQRSLFSWAEFMAEEPGEPKHRRRDEAPTLSLFGRWRRSRRARSPERPARPLRHGLAPCSAGSAR